MTTPRTEQYCQIAVKALALGLQQFQRTEAVGTVLDRADNAATTACTSAAANFQSGRPVTFQLLRPESTSIVVTARLEELTEPPPPVPPPFSSPDLERRWQACRSDFGVSNWMVSSCLDGTIDPLTSPS